MSQRHCLPIFFLVFTAFLTWVADRAGADVPDVHFAIFRLDFQTYTIKGVYEETNPYRKTLVSPGQKQVGNLYFGGVAPGDFGYMKIYSRITGQLLVHAQTIWLGNGSLIEPPESSFTQGYEHGHTAPQPVSLLYAPGGWWDGQDSDLAWAAVKDTDVIKRLASFGDYEVVIYDHFYRVGFSDPTTAEWFVIAFTNPPAPADVGITDLLWPQEIVTRGLSVTPEIVLHNFSADPASPILNGRIEDGSGVVYDMSLPAGEIPADSTVMLTLPSWIPWTLESHTLTFSLQNVSGAPWADAFNDNDQRPRTCDVTSLPVFRFRKPSLAAGGSPGGIPLDLDADGDIDYFHIDYEPKVYENEVEQGFKDITSRFPAFPHWTRAAIASDLDGDGYPELLLADQYTGPPLLLAYGGSEIYSDITNQAGLGGLNGWGGARLLDVDVDGDQDIVMKRATGVYGQNEVAFFLNDTGHFTRAQDTGFEYYTSQISEFLPADLDHDRYPDLVIVAWDSPSEVYRNDGMGHFAVVSGPWSAVTQGRSAIAFDPDLDGDLDLLLLARFSIATSRYFQNNGNLNFVDATQGFGDLPPAFTGGVGDLDEDGYPDVALGDIDDIKAVLLNEAGHFTKHDELLLGGTLTHEIDVLDVDQDGDLDICNRRGSYFENLGVDPSRRFVKAHLTQLTARRDGTTSVIQWSLAEDAHASDFQVYRSTASDPERRNISGAISGRKREYEFVDRQPPSLRTSYWIAEVSRTGGLDWFGPVTVEAVGVGRLALAQNRPNPFNSNTRIVFSLPDPMPVRLSIYNVEGRKVRDLADQVFPQGETVLYWDGNDQQGKVTSSGIYYYQLDSGNRSLIRRMIKIH